MYNKKMRLRDSGDYVWHRDEDRLVCQLGMAIGGKLPRLVVKVHVCQASRIRRMVAGRYASQPNRGYNEGGCLAEYAFAMYLRSLKVWFHWFEFSQERFDFVLESGVTVRRQKPQAS